MCIGGVGGTNGVVAGDVAGGIGPMSVDSVADGVGNASVANDVNIDSESEYY